MSDEPLADVADALRSRGFEFRERGENGRYIFWGPLEGNGATYPCELAVDPTFLRLPRVRLLELPESLPRVAPHIGGAGDVCYVAAGTVSLDIFDPAGQTIACLLQASEVLTSVLKGELREDLEDEFYVYWHGEFCLVDLQETRLGAQRTLLLRVDGRRIPVVTDDEERTRRKVLPFGWEVTETSVPTYRVKTTAKPKPNNRDWPVSTVSELLAWQGLLDQRCRRKLEEQMNKARATKTSVALFLVDSPLMTYGFFIHFRPNARRHRGDKVLPLPLYSHPVFPMTVMRLDDRYAAERNAPGRKTLAGKRLVQIGCGTIGGYLADMLVKAGAGTGGGELVLVDYESLGPQNLGRHRLGFPSLFRSKAVELAQELSRLMPGAKIIPLPEDAQTALLGKFDLLIDATGEEALGHWLSAKYRASSMLTIWIEGPGTAVRGLLRVRGDGACFRCLCDANKKGSLRSVVGDVPKLLAGQGCEGLYVPFPATVSVQAAALGAEMVAAWVNSELSPALRTRVLDAKFVGATPDFDPQMNLECPACRS